MSLLRAIKSDLSAIPRYAKHSINKYFLKITKPDDKTRATAIIMPGYAYPPSGFRNISLRLEEEKIRSKLWSYGFWKEYNYLRGINSYVQEITEEIIDNYYKPGREIYLIGHSLGGLIQRDVLSRLPEPESLVKAAVFIGAPNKGTYAALYNFFVPVCKDMLPRSEYLTELNKKSLPGNIPITNIISRHDLCILPWHSARLPKRENIEEIILHDEGHLAITDRTDLILYGLNRQILTY